MNNEQKNFASFGAGSSSQVAQEVKKGVKELLSTYSLTYHTEPGVLLSPEDGERIASEFYSMIGTPITAWIAQSIESALRDGMDIRLIHEAIEVTARAPRPSSAYFRAVLARWLRDGILSPEAQIADQARHDGATRRQWWQGKFDYAQREDVSAYTAYPYVNLDSASRSDKNIHLTENG